CSCFFFQAEDGIRAFHVTGVQTCALPIWGPGRKCDGSRSGSNNGKPWGEHSVTQLAEGKWVRVRFQNDSTRLHPMHVHGQFFKVDRKSTRLNSSHVKISYAVFCLKKKNN